jgi:ABC-type lipoprotein export system ATPase subunit
VLLADEPTGSLDSSAGKRILELIARLRQQRELTVVMVTHDLSVAGRADRTISMLDGCLAGTPTPASTELSAVSADAGSV